MTALIAPNTPSPTRAAVRTVDVAGVQWPIHKLFAVALALVVGVAAILATGSVIITGWVAGIALLAVWWVGRIVSRDRRDPLAVLSGS